MKIDPKRYDTEVAKIVAEGPTGILASIGSYLISQGINLSDKEEVEHASRISIGALIDFPEKFKGYTLLAEIEGVNNLKLWDDIDPDHRCLGNLTWFGESTFHISAHVSLETIKNMSTLLRHSSSDDSLSWLLKATAIGMESIEFENRETPKGVAVTNVHCSLKGTLDKSIYLDKGENDF